jgi:hypothetical protein
MKAMTSVPRSKNSSTKLRDSMSSGISVVSVASFGSGLRPEPSGGGRVPSATGSPVLVFQHPLSFF